MTDLFKNPRRWIIRTLLAYLAAALVGGVIFLGAVAALTTMFPHS